MVFAELQITRPVLAAVYFGLSLAVSMALLGAVYGKPLADLAEIAQILLASMTASTPAATSGTA
jgi:ABC-type Fe3+-siderophore transport system permease subunit